MRPAAELDLPQANPMQGSSHEHHESPPMRLCAHCQGPLPRAESNGPEAPRFCCYGCRLLGERPADPEATDPGAGKGVFRIVFGAVIASQAISRKKANRTPATPRTIHQRKGRPRHIRPVCGAAADVPAPSGKDQPSPAPSPAYCGCQGALSNTEVLAAMADLSALAERSGRPRIARSHFIARTVLSNQHSIG